MKPWIWFVLFLLTVAGGVYLVKRGTPNSIPLPEPSPTADGQPLVPNPAQPKSPTVLPSPRGSDPSMATPPVNPDPYTSGVEPGGVYSPPPVPEAYPEGDSGQAPEPFPGAIPPPPPPVYPSPELDAPPEYFDGEVPQPFEPPPPLDENDVPMPPVYDPGAEL